MIKRRFIPVVSLAVVVLVVTQVGYHMVEDDQQDQPLTDLQSTRCDRKRFEFEVSDDVEWDIPEALGSCNVSVYGDPGVTFDVFLPPDSI